MQNKLTEIKEAVWSYYGEHGRYDLPWRINPAPYRVWVSETMLQQTQVSRAIEKFNAWMEQFPDVGALAHASRSDVLLAWQGLGYNNRAIRLHTSAQILEQNHKGAIPDIYDQLIALPGVGDYTASAVLAFAYDQPSVVIDTNIRRIVLHHVFDSESEVHDKDVRPVVEQLVQGVESPRNWYNACMDYGSHLGHTLSWNPNRRSKQYSKQSKFEGSVRQVRSMILKMLLQEDGLSFHELVSRIDVDESDKRIQPALDGLKRDGVITVDNSKITLQES